jgi:hypothetical protein
MAYVGPWQISAQVSERRRGSYFVYVGHKDLTNGGRIANADLVVPNANKYTWRSVSTGMLKGTRCRYRVSDAAQ